MCTKPKDRARRRLAAKLLRKDEARRIAANIAKLPESSDADAAVVDSLKALDPNRPIREADSCTAAKITLLDHLVSGDEQSLRHRDAERLGGLEIDHQLEFRGLLNRKIAGLRALENLVHVLGKTLLHG
jgi:hypothetical protein